MLKNNVFISYSQLSDFLGCSFKHYLGYTKKLKKFNNENIHLLFGTSIHSSIEKYLKGELDIYGAIIKFSRSIINSETIKKYNHSDLLKFDVQGKKILYELFNKFNWRSISVIANEYKLEEHIFDYFYFKGIIDFIYKYNNITYIVDWKTSSNSWDTYKLNDEYYGLQLKLYKYFYCKKNNINPNSVKLMYIVLNRNDSNIATPELVQIHNVDGSNEEIKKAYDILVSSLKVMYEPELFENYLRQTIGWNCNICEFNESDFCKGNRETNFYRDFKKGMVSSKETSETASEQIEKNLQKRIEFYWKNNGSV